VSPNLESNQRNLLIQRYLKAKFQWFNRYAVFKPFNRYAQFKSCAETKRETSKFGNSRTPTLAGAIAVGGVLLSAYVDDLGSESEVIRPQKYNFVAGKCGITET
jgi:hypothetical protein